MRPLTLLVGAAFLLVGCGEGNPFEDVPPRVREGAERLWEVSAGNLPSAFDFLSGRRLFLGAGDIGSTLGDVFLDGAPGSTELRLRSVDSLLRGESVHSVEIQDLGAVDFGGVREVPDAGYLAAGDTTGAPVVQGHVYALRINTSEIAPNFAKLLVEAVGSTNGERDRQFVDFRSAVQLQPGNRSFEGGE